MKHVDGYLAFPVNVHLTGKPRNNAISEQIADL